MWFRPLRRPPDITDRPLLLRTIITAALVPVLVLSALALVPVLAVMVPGDTGLVMALADTGAMADATKSPAMVF